jgi:hypothetical protein
MNHATGNCPSNIPVKLKKLSRHACPLKCCEAILDHELPPSAVTSTFTRLSESPESQTMVYFSPA